MGVIGAILQKLGSLLKNEYNLQKSIEDGGVESLMTELEYMQAFLEKVSSVPADELDKNTKLWARDVRELSYNIDDHLDTFLVHMEGKKIETGQNIKWRFHSARKMVSDAMARHNLAVSIKDTMARDKEAKERHDRYNLDGIVPSATIKPVDPRLHALYKHVNQLIGIEKPGVELINMLNRGDDEVSRKKLKSISIVGPGGLGKTTLAKATYEKIKGEFKCCAFVSVGQNPEVKKVLKDILHELDKKQYRDIHNLIRDEKQLIDLILEFLGNKRYFLVIDDIWDIQSWETIKLALTENNCGSTIITTTRNFKVAKAASDIYELAPLSYDDSKNLLCTRIFDDKGKCPKNQPSEVLDKILEKCAGVPLAIITIGSLLADKPREEWSEVFDSIGFGREDSKHVDNTMRILSFSYYDMPFHLRTCLLYLSVYPEDYFISKHHLIRMWIAEGFVQQIQGAGLFELGERYFNDLANRSMIQIQIVDDRFGGGTVEYCCVHDMVLALVRLISSEENFVTILDNEQAPLSSCNKIRRLSHQNKAVLQHSWKTQMDTTHMRSYISYCQTDSMVQFSSFKFLRVLVLVSLEDNYYCLTHLGDLLHLRYLGVSPISELHKEIEALKFLQTLELEVMMDDDIIELSSIGLLTQLVCLHIGNVWKFVDGIIGNLKSLEELSIGLDISSNGNGKPAIRNLLTELGNLTELRILDVVVYCDCEDEDSEEVPLESLRNLHKIRKLSLILEGSGTSASRQLEAPGYVPSRQLQYFVFEHCFFYHMPTWINSSLLPNLSHLSIEVRSLKNGDIKVLGGLPELRSLRLNTRSNVVLCGGGDGNFLKLRSCKLDTNGATVMFRPDESGVPPMPRLEILDLIVYIAEWKHLCARHGQSVSFLPTVIGLHNIPLLKEIRGFIKYHGITWSEGLTVQCALERAASTHTNHPSFQLYGNGGIHEFQLYQDKQHRVDSIYLRKFEFHVHVRELNDMGYAFDFSNLRHWSLPSLEQVLAHVKCLHWKRH